MEPIFSLRQANKDKKWFQDYMNYVVPYDTTAVTDYQKMRMVYGVLNNDISIIKDQLNALCKPLGDAFDFSGQIDEEIVVYNRLFPKYMYLIGEMLKRGDAFDVMVTSSDAHNLKTEELRQIYERSIDEKIRLMMESIDLEAQGASPQDIQAYYEQMRSQEEPEDFDSKSFSSEIEMFYSRVLQYFNWKFNLKRLKALSFKHTVVGDRAFIGVFEKNGFPCPVVCNVIHCGFHKSPDEERVEKGDWFWIKTAITVSQAMDELHDKVSDEELQKLSGYTGNSNLRPNEAWDIKSGKAHTQYNYSSVNEARESMSPLDKHVGQSMGSGTNRRYNTDRLISKTYIQFKAYVDLILYTYTNDYGNEVSEFVPGNFEIPEDAVKVTHKDRWGKDTHRWEWIDDFGNPAYAEKLSVPRRFEATKYASDLIVDYREVPNQPLSIDNPFDFELGIKGKIFTNLNSEPISLVERAISPFLQYQFIKLLQNRELAKYEGYIKNIDASQIPDYLAHDENGEPLYEGVDKLAIWRYFRRKLGESYYDPNLASTGSLMNNQKTVPVTAEAAGNFAELVNMQNMLSLIDREIGIQMLVPPQAEGIFEPYSNVSDNQKALDQGYTMAEEYYSVHNEVWRSVLNEYLHQFRIAYQRFFEENPDTTETSLAYITPEGTKELLTITPELLKHEEMGVFITDTTYSESYRRWMTSQLQAIAQNAGEGTVLLSELVMALSRGESPETVHKMIVIADKKQQKRLQEMEKMKQEAAVRQLEEIRKHEELKHAHKLEQIDTTKEHDKEIKALDIFKFTQDKNQDQDGVPDYLEAMKLVREENRKDQDQNFRERQHRDKMEVERKKLAKKT